MADLTIASQKAVADQVQVKTSELNTELDKRKEVWNRMPVEKKKKWIASGKDPVMSLAWQNYRYLRDNFFREMD